MWTCCKGSFWSYCCSPPKHEPLVGEFRNRALGFHGSRNKFDGVRSRANRLENEQVPAQILTYTMFLMYAFAGWVMTYSHVFRVLFSMSNG